MQIKTVNRKKFKRKDKIKILKSQNNKCATCKILINESDVFSLDHINPLGLGGTNRRDNLQVLCCSCDKIKTSKDMKDIWKARKETNNGN